MSDPKFQWGIAGRPRKGFWAPGTLTGPLDPQIPNLPLEFVSGTPSGTASIVLDAVTTSGAGALAIRGVYVAPGARFTLLTSGTDVDETSSATTASINVTAGVPVVIDVVSDSAASNQDQSPTGITGPGGMTFTKVAETNPDTDFIWLSRWVAVPSSTASGVCTISFANAMDVVVWSVVRVDNAGRATNNGVDMFRQTVTGNVALGSGTADSETLAAYGDSVNRPLVAFMAENGSATVRTATAEAGWTELMDTGADGGGFSMALTTMWRADTSDTTPSVTWSAGTGILAAIASELYGAQDIQDTTTTAAGTLSATGNSGAAAITLDGVTTAATGVLPIAGASAQTLAAVTTSATGALQIQGTASITLGDVTTSATGSLLIQGTASITLGDVTTSATGSLGSPITGDAAITLDGVTTTATGALQIQGTASITLGGVTTAATGALLLQGAAAINLADVITAAAGNLAIEGTADITLDAVVSAATGELQITGVAALTLGDVAVFATGEDPNAGGGDDGTATRHRHKIVTVGRMLVG